MNARVYRCKRCKGVVQSNQPIKWMNEREDRCYDSAAPSGYWYCNYEELVPSKRGKKTTKR